MKIHEVLTLNVTRIPLKATLRQAADLLSATQASDLMVVDETNGFVGVLSEGDLIRAALPQFDELMAAGSVTSGFDLFREKGQALATSPIAPLVIKQAIVVSPEDEVLKAASLMVRHQIRRLPVVEQGKLVGTISRADVCSAVLWG